MTMTRLAKLLSSLDATLDTEDAPAAAEANADIWKYLSAFDGLSQQKQALDDLTAAFATRPADSTFHVMVRRQIAQHQRRLTGE